MSIDIKETARLCSWRSGLLVKCCNWKEKEVAWPMSGTRFPSCQQPIGGRFIKIISLASNVLVARQLKGLRHCTVLLISAINCYKLNCWKCYLKAVKMAVMSVKMTLFLCLLLVKQAYLNGSGSNDLSGDWDDNDDDIDDQKQRATQNNNRVPSRIVPTTSTMSARGISGTTELSITRNSSDFHIARDDHEKIINLRRMNNKNSKNWLKKRCLVSVVSSTTQNHSGYKTLNS